MLNHLSNILIRLVLGAIALLLILLAILVPVLFLTTPGLIEWPDWLTAWLDGSTETTQPGDTNESGDTGESGTPDAPPVDDGVTLPETPDAGKAYQDKLIFVGDSLTAHLVNRGVLSDGQATRQVWHTENNILNLNAAVTSAKIIHPSTGEAITIAEAAGRDKPEILVITLGTDWGVSYLGETDFKACYTALIRDIQAASPDTTIILQSIFPVTEDCTLLDNEKIDTANRWVKAIAAENGCRYLDTQSILKNDKNALKAEYCNSSDGIHLGKNAYEAILTYIRTHAAD